MSSSVRVLKGQSFCDSDYFSLRSATIVIGRSTQQPSTISNDFQAVLMSENLSNRYEKDLNWLSKLLLQNIAQQEPIIESICQSSLSPKCLRPTII